MIAVGAISRLNEAFTTRWIAPGGRAYVGRYGPAPARAIDLVRAAGGVAALAHPRAGRGWPLAMELLAELAANGLAGIEVDHPDHNQAERAQLRREASELGLLVLGSSDDHGSLTGHRIGRETTSPGVYEHVLALATGAKPVHGPPL